MAAGRYSKEPNSSYNADKFVALQNPTNPTTSSGSSEQGSQNTSWNQGQQSSSSTQRSSSVQGSQQSSRQESQGTSQTQSTSFSGIEDPEALAILMDFIRQSSSGGTAEQKAQRQERLKQLGITRGISTDYTTDMAMADAAALMAQNLRQSYERSAPMIAKAIQGAGTSAASMQGLLATKLATDSAQAAGALGAEQAKAYGQTQAQLQAVMENLTRIDPSAEQSLLKALELTKIQKSQSTGSSQQSSTGTSQGSSFGTSQSSTDSTSQGTSAGGSQGTSFGNSKQQSQSGGGGGSRLEQIPEAAPSMPMNSGSLSDTYEGYIQQGTKPVAEWYTPQTNTGGSTMVNQYESYVPTEYDGVDTTYQGEVPSEEDTWGYGD